MRIVLAALLVVSLGAITLGAQEGGRPATGSAAAVTLVNLNTATMAQLQSLPGIGPATAQRILEYRQEHGAFQKIEELMNVRGIGEATFLKLRTLVSVTSPRADRAASQ